MRTTDHFSPPHPPHLLSHVLSVGGAPISSPPSSSSTKVNLGSLINSHANRGSSAGKRASDDVMDKVIMEGVRMEEQRRRKREMEIEVRGSEGTEKRQATVGAKRQQKHCTAFLYN